MNDAPAILPPGSVIGVLGGGQLGRMTALAAAELGYRVHVYCPEVDAPASHVAWRTTHAAYDDEAALELFVRSVAVVTVEFENIPVSTLRFLASFVPTRPSADVLATCQDRWNEKTFLRENGIPTAPFQKIDQLFDLKSALNELTERAILKTRRLGYDGKGQVTVRPKTPPAEAWRAIGEVPSILEDFVDFEREISVIVARGIDGEARAFVPVDNVHKNHILSVTTAPARISSALAGDAIAIAERIAVALDLVGLVAVEMFVTRDGRLLVNELAPRPHNSGHWTIDACLVSQFEQHVRAVCGLPLGSPERHSDAVMTNLIGDDVERWREAVERSNARVHLYGKTEARPGRKMGHITEIFARRE
ncbi:MAG: 5-(carboxyamino)imidazole ribonucleotide synthase [Alphaproteobacteria bacterium]